MCEKYISLIITCQKYNLVIGPKPEKYLIPLNLHCVVAEGEMMILINRQQFLILISLLSLLSLVFSQTRNLTSHPRSSWPGHCTKATVQCLYVSLPRHASYEDIN